MTRLESFTAAVAPPFPPIAVHEVMEIADLEALVPTRQPKGPAMALHTAKLDWLPCNEQLAVQLGHAQHALRLLDDDRALVVAMQIHRDLILIDLGRAPNRLRVEWQHAENRGGRTMVTADLAGADDSVLLRWPLEIEA